MARVIKVITVQTPAFTNITGLVPHGSLDFVEEVQLWRGGAHLVTGLTALTNIDAIPGNNPAAGDIKLTAEQPTLEIGEVLVMQSFTLYETAIVNPQYIFDAGIGTGALKVLVWAEQKGQLNGSPVSADLSLRIGTDAPLKVFTTNSSPDAEGVFTFEDADIVLPKGELYVLDVSIDVGGKTITTKRGFNLG